MAAVRGGRPPGDPDHPRHQARRAGDAAGLRRGPERVRLRAGQPATLSQRRAASARRCRLGAAHRRPGGARSPRTPRSGRLLIDIAYRVRATNALQNLVYPFYLQEGPLTWRRGPRQPRVRRRPTRPSRGRCSRAGPATCPSGGRGDVGRRRGDDLGSSPASSGRSRDRLDQAPVKHSLAFLDLLGIRLIPARAARAPIVFRWRSRLIRTRWRTSRRRPDPGRHARGRAAAARRQRQVIFETERATGIAVARLQNVVSVWPGRDQYIDHTEACRAGQPFRPFALAELKDTPHALYLAHSTMLALAGTSRVDVSFELTTPGSERLDIAWEYWDGKLWREFSEPAARLRRRGRRARRSDGTSGLHPQRDPPARGDGGEATHDDGRRGREPSGSAGGSTSRCRRTRRASCRRSTGSG